MHPASASSGPDSRLWGSSGTSNDTFAPSGSLFILSFLVFVVVMGTLEGVSNDLFLSCTSASSATASFPKQVKDATVSKNAVVFLGFGGGAQPKLLPMLT